MWRFVFRGEIAETDHAHRRIRPAEEATRRRDACRKVDVSTSDPGLTLAGLPPPLAAAGAQLNAILNAQLGAIPRQGTVSLGARWDFMRNFALKLQYDRVSLDSSSYGTFGNVQPEFHAGGRVQLFSAAVDFVF